MFTNKLLRVLAFVCLLLTLVFLTGFSPNAATTYYVSCSGNDSNSGKSPTQPWKTLTKANAASLLPGDKLLFRRGCAWQGTLNAKWNGTEAAAITIGAYKNGAPPLIQNSPADVADKFHINVKVTGSWLIIENIATTIVDPPVSPGCENNPLGWYVGFNFVNPNNLPNGGSHNVLRFASATFHTAGVHMQTSTHNNAVLNSTFTDNNAMEQLTPINVGATDDIGAWGILLKGNNHEIAHNFLTRNNSWCTFDTNPQGNSVELYEAKNNVIHHNIAVDDRVFSELGSSSNVVSENNVFAYNLIVSSILDAKFVTTRGAEADFGPVLSTQLFRNTVYLTGAESQGLVCGGGCYSSVLTAKGNIFWAEWKSAFVGNPFNESNNIYWATDGTPFVQFLGFSMHPTSMKANPQFVGSGNFWLKPSSPAIDAGFGLGWLLDLAGVTVPQGSAEDIGAYEFVP